jgi:hypothetical protein
VLSHDRYIGEPALIRVGTGKGAGENAGASATNMHTPQP